MNRTAEHFFEEMREKRITFIGLGVSHRELVRQFRKKGLDVAVCDRREKDYLDGAEELEDLGVRFHLGEDYLEHLDGDVIFRTPGMRYYIPELTAAREAGKVVTSELEVFFELCPCPIIGITGSDGKTTTSTLIAEMLKASGTTVHLGGNIGRALLPIVDGISPEDVAVVELSSFQLISMRKSPDIAVVTNLAPNHLDMHKDMEEYVDAKRNICRHQSAFGVTVLNADNEIASGFRAEVRCGLRTFSRKEEPRFGAFLGEDGYLHMVTEEGRTRLFPAKDIRLPGVHNIENYLAAITAVWDMVSPEVMHQVAQDFGGVEHRIEFVRERNGVRWYNDSIATSPTRTIAGLDAFDQKIILIAGGYDKKIPFLPLGPKVIQKVKKLILMGATADKIEATVTGMSGYSAKELPIFRVENMEEAVAAADREAEPGDIVSLSPACAGFDMYRNFEMRGRHFKELVNGMG